MPDTPKTPSASNANNAANNAGNDAGNGGANGPDGPHTPATEAEIAAAPPAENAEAHGVAPDEMEDGDATRALSAISPDDMTDDRLAEVGERAGAPAAPATPKPAPGDDTALNESPRRVNAADAVDHDAPGVQPQPATPANDDAAPRVAVAQLSGADDGKVTVVIGPPIIIGRIASDVTVALQRDQWASRRHAQISFHDGAWWLEDLHSSNGTTIGSERRPVRQPTALPLGEVFRVGHTDLMLTDEPAALASNAVAL